MLGKKKRTTWSIKRLTSFHISKMQKYKKTLYIIYTLCDNTITICKGAVKIKMLCVQKQKAEWDFDGVHGRLQFYL